MLCQQQVALVAGQPLAQRRRDVLEHLIRGDERDMHLTVGVVHAGQVIGDVFIARGAALVAHSVIVVVGPDAVALAVGIDARDPLGVGVDAPLDRGGIRPRVERRDDGSPIRPLP